MIDLAYEMTYSERIEGPLPTTAGSPLGDPVCWRIAEATLRGPRIDATLAMPGIIRTTRRFTDALANGRATVFAEQYTIEYEIARVAGADGPGLVS